MNFTVEMARRAGGSGPFPTTEQTQREDRRR
jgi:hypothetical protein